MAGERERTMTGLDIAPWEPEESVGKVWHALVSRLETDVDHADAAVTLDQARPRLGILFRGLGGARDVAIDAAAVQRSTHRLSWRRKLAEGSQRIAEPSFDGEALRMPDRIAAFPTREMNGALYAWLAAAAAHAPPAIGDDDPLRADMRALQSAVAITRAVLDDCPGLRSLHGRLAAACLAIRPRRSLAGVEAAVEATIVHLLGGPPPMDRAAAAITAAVVGIADDLSAFAAPAGYRRFLPVPMWLDVRPCAARVKSERTDDTADGRPPTDGGPDQRTHKASRKEADQAARKDSLIIHKFESILSWAEFLNINRRVEDDDADNAAKAADDQDEIALTKVPQKTRARLRLHLDLSPTEADFERIAGKYVYPEWDHRKRIYMPDYCRVLAAPAEPADAPPAFLADPRTRRRIQRVRRQFEALRPKRVHVKRQIEGDEIDIEAAVAARVELRATGAHSDRIYRASRSEQRDLAVSILFDASRSTESHVAGRQVIDIAREALIALAWGLDACGDDTSISAFSSLKRERVFIHSCKGFDDRMDSRVESRIAGLRPGHFTRLGAAIRHVSHELSKRPRQRRLLLVLTDGKPNDLDHYEGRHGIEDTHMAVREARRLGQSVFGVTIDSKSQASFSRIFGRGGYVVIPEPDKLTTALPEIYRHLVST